MSDKQYVKKDEARVIIKTHKSTEGTKFELDINFSKSDATKILVYAIELAAKSKGEQS